MLISFHFKDSLNKEKSVAMATSLERSQPHFNPENVAKIGRVFCEIIGLEHMEKPEAVSAVINPFDR